MSKKQKNGLIRIIIAFVLFIVVWLLPLEGLPRMIAFLFVYLFSGWDILWEAIQNIFRGQVFDENFLMSVASLGAFILGDYPEGIAVMIFYQVGEWFQSYAVGRSRASVTELMDIRPDYANLEKDGQLLKVSPEEVAIGDTILVKPGERVPLDGIVLSGISSLDTSALTGESMPRNIEVGDDVISGCVNIDGNLQVKVSKAYGESTVSKILNLVENSSAKKAKAENFITKFSRYYTPLVCLAALILAVVPPLITQSDFSPWIYRALTFLVISCPCALVISVPLGFFAGIGGASKIGVLIKGSNYMETLAKTNTVVFDKTGTLTQGKFAVTNIFPQDMNEEDLLKYAAYAEEYSSHPIATSIKKAYGTEINTAEIDNVKEIAGHGVSCTVQGKLVLAGNIKLMRSNNIQFTEPNAVGTVVYVAVDGKFAGAINIEDQLKPDAQKAISELKKEGIRETVMLTGDNNEVGQKVGKQLDMDSIYTQLLPADKVEKVEALLAKEDPKEKLAFVGDGINDAPVLARADVGIAMGALGSDAAIEAADVVIMTDEISKVPAVIKLSRKTLRIVQQDTVFALSVKLIILILGALGIANMWAAVFADVGVSILAILNSMRSLKVDKSMKIKK